MPNTTQAAADIANYSSKAKSLNSGSLLTNAVATPTFLCLNSLVKQGLSCVSSTGSTSGSFNAVRVVQQRTPQRGSDPCSASPASN